MAEGAAGRFFERAKLPGIADATGSGRVRVDAIARWLQDVAYEDLLDAGLEERGVWVVRRTALGVEAFPRFGEEVTLRTQCTGIGRFSAERTTTIEGGGAAVRAVALWVWLDRETLRPQRFPPEFVDVYRASAAGRDAKVRLSHPDPPTDGPRAPWRLRAADLDVAGHVNNASYLAVLEEELIGADPKSLEVEIEYRNPAGVGDAWVIRADGWRWIVDETGTTYASLRAE